MLENTIDDVAFKVIKKNVQVAGGSTIPGYKALVREDTGDKLSIVSDQYEVVQNPDLIAEVESWFKRVGIKDEGILRRGTSSKGGAWTKMEWIMKDITVPSTEQSKSNIAFRVICVNGFGTSAVKLYSGAIDFYCDNGIIVGSHDLVFRKAHYGAVDAEYAYEGFQEALEVYADHHSIWKEWQRKHLPLPIGAEFLDNHFNTSLAGKLNRQYEREVEDRGENVWSLYSALTNYASHCDGEFPLSPRSAGNEAATMMDREIKVKHLTESVPFLKLVSN